MKRAQWTHSAASDLRDIETYLAGYHPAVAHETVERALTAARFLLDHPSVGSPISGRWRKWRVPRTRYLLLYRPIKGGIEIGRVRYDRSDWTRSPT